MSIKKDFSQYSYHPITKPLLNSYYEKQRNVFWTAQEISHKGDRSDWDVLDVDSKRFIKFVLCFFAQADGIINENLIENFKIETSFYKEARHFYAIQEVIEICHNEVYSNLIEAFIRDEDEKKQAFDAISNFSSIKAIAELMFKWMDKSIPLAERIVAFSCVEGILFSSAFAAIYWIKRRNILLALCLANEWIARDETIHTEFAIALYHTMVKDGMCLALSQERIHAIIKDFVDVSDLFNREALRVDLIGMNINDMMDYVKCTADMLSTSYGYDKIYNSKNKFGDWMVIIGLPSKSNFFEKVSTEYGKNEDGDYEFDTEADF